jgi:hypothetical protein
VLVAPVALPGVQAPQFLQGRDGGDIKRYSSSKTSCHNHNSNNSNNNNTTRDTSWPSSPSRRPERLPFAPSFWASLRQPHSKHMQKPKQTQHKV